MKKKTTILVLMILTIILMPVLAVANADANAETAKSSGYFWLVIAAITCLISFGVSQVSPISNAAPGAVKMINNILFGVSIGSLLWAGIEAATI